MAVISHTNNKAVVQAQGTAMSAKVNFSGALMEMLATVYKYILMAAIREAVQNGCDAVKRAGISFSEGVLVTLPTLDNPMITIVDCGSGMTKAFMEDEYLSFGTSTKNGDNGSAGGLGVGRWAAYGYIRECFITTCHASDLVERTYFQFQDENSTPQVQPASEVPGTRVGTRVSFPVKETDIDEALRAVAWLKEVMQLTMGDSFSVDTPDRLPGMLPPHSGHVLELGDVDPGLAGIRVLPMQGSALQYGRQGVQAGSLVVLSNQQVGVGGLPFHVQSPSDNLSVFDTGMIIDIPLSFQVPFMPSREEIKYTDDVTALLRRIDAAARVKLIQTVGALYSRKQLDTYASISRLIGTASYEKQEWHAFRRAAESRTADGWVAELRLAIGGRDWDGCLRVEAVSEMRTADVSLRHVDARHGVLRAAFSYGGQLYYREGKAREFPVLVTATRPLTLVVNDLPSGGVSRFRYWLAGAPAGKYLFISAATAELAGQVATALNAQFEGGLPLLHTSGLPSIVAPRQIIGGRVRSKAEVASLSYHCFRLGKQQSESVAFDAPSQGTLPDCRRVWLTKDGGALAGMREDSRLADLVDNNNWSNPGSIRETLALQSFTRLYLLTAKQAAELVKLQADAQRDGLWDAEAADFADDAEGQESYAAVQALKSWVPLETVAAEILASPRLRSFRAGQIATKVTESWELSDLVGALIRKPRMELTGTALDRALAPFADVLAGESKLLSHATVEHGLHRAVVGLITLGETMDVTVDDTAERKELVTALLALKDLGHADYGQAWRGLTDRFPILLALKDRHFGGKDDRVVDHVCLALAAVCR